MTQGSLSPELVHLVHQDDVLVPNAVISPVIKGLHIVLFGLLPLGTADNSRHMSEI